MHINNGISIVPIVSYFPNIQHVCTLNHDLYYYDNQKNKQAINFLTH